jgi:hypothetical protein
MAAGSLHLRTGRHWLLQLLLLTTYWLLWLPLLQMLLLSRYTLIGYTLGNHSRLLV